MKESARQRGLRTRSTITSSDMPRELVRKGYSSNGERHGVDPVKHLLRNQGNVPALDVVAVNLWRAAGVPQIRVLLTNGVVMTAGLEQFLHEAMVLNYGHGPQFCAPRSVWNYGSTPHRQPEA